MKLRILLTIILLQIAFCMKGQTVSRVSYATRFAPSGQRMFGVRDGLPANAITSVKQDCHGLVWVATWNGLCCYDGYQFITFRSEPWGTENALSTGRISTIESDSRGNIWIRTYDAGLYLLDTERCQFFNVGLLIEKRYGETITPRNIYCLPNGYTWIIDEGRKMNLRIDDHHPLDVDRMEIWGTKGHPLPNGTHIRKVETDPQGREWIVTDQGMTRYGTNEFRKNVFTHYSSPNTSKGGERPSGTNGAAEEYVRQHNIGKHLIDRQGNLWHWSAEGLGLVTFRNDCMHLLPLADRQQTRALLCRRNGDIWAGNYGGNIAVLRPDGQLAGYVNRHGQVGSQPIAFDNAIYALHEDRQGNVWIGTRGDGCWVIGADGEAIGHYRHHDDDAYSLSNDNIFDIDEDEHGNIWIATWGGGVNCVASSNLPLKGEANMRFLHKGNELKGYPKEGFDKVRRITHDSRGNMLASTTTGLLTWGLCQTPTKEAIRFYTTRHEQGDTTSLQASDVMQTLVTRSGAIFVATMGGGIQQLASTNLLHDGLKLRQVSAMNQGAGNALSMTEDPLGNIWITRESEVNRYDVKTGRLEQYGPNSMAEQADLTEAKTILAPDGSLWLGTTAGVMTFRTHDMKKSGYQPEMVFTGILYQGEQQDHPLLYRRQLDIADKEHRNLTIHFAALDYGDNYLLQYAYRLKEDDSQLWNYIGRTPRITFNQLSPGRHTLVVKSTNCDGVWANNETELAIYVQPTLWERTWVRLLLLLLVMGLTTWGVIRYLHYRQANREREQRMESLMRQYRELSEQTYPNLPKGEEPCSPPLEGQGEVQRVYTLEEPKIVDEDEVMMNRLMAFIEQHVSDEHLKIDDMAEAVGMGRTVFYEKVRQLVGVSPSDFLRQVRMQRAEQLVAKSRMTFAEIAYAVGFTDPKYFSKCFKKQTGMTPSEYRSKR